MKSKIDQHWNPNVENNVQKLKPVKDWLERWINNKDTDWESQKSAHQALKLLEMAEYEMWNMQYWTTRKQRDLYNEAEDTIV